MFDIEGSKQPVERLNFPFFPQGILGNRALGRAYEARAQFDVQQERAASVPAGDLCESAALTCWVPQDEAVKEGDTH